MKMTNESGKSLIKSVGESDDDAKARAELEDEKAKFAALSQRKASMDKQARKDYADEKQSPGTPLRTATDKHGVEEMTARRGLVIVNRDPSYGLAHPQSFERHQQIEGGVVERQVPIRGSGEGALITEDFSTTKVTLSVNDFTNGGPGCYAIIALDAPTLGRLIRVKVGTLVAVTAGFSAAIGVSQRAMPNTIAGFTAFLTTYEPWVYATHQSFTPDVNIGGAAQVALDRIFNAPVPYNNQDNMVFPTGFVAATQYPQRKVYLVIAINTIKANLPQINFLEVTLWEKEVV